MLTRAIPCPTCGCGPGECAICQSPNQTVASIFITFTISGVGNGACSDCVTDLNDTFVIEMPRTLIETACYNIQTIAARVCGSDLLSPAVSIGAAISRPDMSNNVTITISGSSVGGSFTASYVLPLPIDCEDFGAAIPMTIDFASTDPGDLCDFSAIAIEFSLSV